MDFSTKNLPNHSNFDCNRTITCHYACISNITCLIFIEAKTVSKCVHRNEISILYPIQFSRVTVFEAIEYEGRKKSALVLAVYSNLPSIGLYLHGN
jgi:hypothetical protein